MDRRCDPIVHGNSTMVRSYQHLFGKDRRESRKFRPARKLNEPSWSALLHPTPYSQWNQIMLYPSIHRQKPHWTRIYTADAIWGRTRLRQVFLFLQRNLTTTASAPTLPPPRTSPECPSIGAMLTVSNHFGRFVHRSFIHTPRLRLSQTLFIVEL